MTEPLLEVDDLTIQYETDSGPITAVSNANFTVDRGAFTGLAGESGCGKSTVADAIIGGLDPNGKVESGSIRYKGDPIHDYDETQMNEEIRWKEISFIPQASLNSLDPLEKISTQVVRIGKTHTELSKKEILAKFEDMFEVMGLSTDRIDDYPHQFSGGMRQRATMAIAMFLEPDLIIADEPTTALDVIMQDRIFNHLEGTRDETDASMLLITHDISLIFEFCDTLSIMHAGQICETGTSLDIFQNPRHPYSILLQEAFPDIRYPDRQLETIQGNPPLLDTDEVDFCTFADRCPWATEECVRNAPQPDPIPEDEDHVVSCFHSDTVHSRYEEGDVPDVAERNVDFGGSV